MNDRSAVLIVDDDAAVLESTGALLEDDFHVVTTASAEAALTLLSRRTFDVLCTDHNMPGMTGSALLERAEEMHPGIGRVLITGMSASFQEREATSRSYGVLIKPYDPDRLFEMVKQQARMSRMRRAVSAMRESMPDQGHGTDSE